LHRGLSADGSIKPPDGLLPRGFTPVNGVFSSCHPVRCRSISPDWQRILLDGEFRAHLKGTLRLHRTPQAWELNLADAVAARTAAWEEADVAERRVSVLAVLQAPQAGALHLQQAAAAADRAVKHAEGASARHAAAAADAREVYRAERAAQQREESSLVGLRAAAATAHEALAPSRAERDAAAALLAANAKLVDDAARGKPMHLGRIM
jgi:hypothetical protein